MYVISCNILIFCYSQKFHCVHEQQTMNILVNILCAIRYWSTVAQVFVNGLPVLEKHDQI